MLSAFGIVASCNVLFVAWRVWVAHRHPRDAAPRELADTAPAGHVTTTV
ncbi:hypothetical protein OVY01_05980 [Robbsia sp. Bb-Pol-6]|uniref:Uncharacterized protein n=1 Tax=Robbsia betulipollinis TaxID=2981849 RepID=A0ABT3ZJT9_9BURK|nr:hypothetical protein [Robbsia betulipollinis]MCY0386789.1 hypothetical protein [Robbsia betulipollinis]